MVFNIQSVIKCLLVKPFALLLLPSPSIAAAYGTWGGTRFYKTPGGAEIIYKQVSARKGGPYVLVPPLGKWGDWCKYTMVGLFPTETAWAKCDSINRNDFGGI